MSADFNPLDTTGQNKVLEAIQRLVNAGLSNDEILQYFNQSQALGRSALQDYYNTAGTNIAQRFQPQFDAARNNLGANPLLADSGYANRLNRQLMSDLGMRLAGDFGQHAAEQAGSNVGFYQSLVGQRNSLRNALAERGYETMTGLPRRRKTNLGNVLAQLGGGVAGAIVGGPGGALAGSQLAGGLSGGRDAAAYYSPQDAPDTNSFFGYDPYSAPRYRPAYRPMGNQ